MTDEECAELDRKRAGIPVAVALRLAVKDWPGLLPLEDDPLA